MPDLVKVLDISNYQDIPTPAQVLTWQNAGIGHVIVRGSLETPGKTLKAQQQLEVLVGGGMPVSVYGWYYQSLNPVQQAQLLTTHFSFYQPYCYWLDCEETADKGSPGQVVAWVQDWALALQAAEVRCGIYTGSWWWVPYTNDSTDFAALPLWTAEYDGVAQLTPAGYGGWDVPTGKQYADTGGIDRSVFDAAFFEEDDMSTISDLRNLLGYLQGDVAVDLQKAIDGKSWKAVKAVLNTLRTAGKT